MLSPSKDKTDELYASLQEYFNIEDDGDLKNYLGVELDHCPYVSIRISQTYLTQRILINIPGMEKSIAKPTPTVNPPPPQKKLWISINKKRIYL